MTYIVTEACIRCKYMDCIEVCPVDCLYEGENMLIIHPDECIDCGVCEPECPPEAILPDTDPKAEAWLELMEMLWEVAYADGELHHLEANLMRRLAGLLQVPDRDSGAARKRALKRLDSPNT